jgi:hypothetical protein
VCKIEQRPITCTSLQAEVPMRLFILTTIHISSDGVTAFLEKLDVYGAGTHMYGTGIYVW